MILLENYLGQHGKGHEGELTDDMKLEAQVLVDKVNAMLEEFGGARELRSGWRPESFNAGVPNAAKNSKHITCQAMDIADEDGVLKEWALQKDGDSYPVLEKYELWAEYGEATGSWLHVKIVPPVSKKRVFYPSAKWALRAQQEHNA